ncbi:hypothetical protein OH799_05075 [Nocardia sp. NBC_00881]|uniref:hypothetical protein n=1 Tax=Nocardia sp. NBC_00881 TaxID=2975995 RepID=UPI00386360D5|nr:hypothetical protein OH799_05075 [Nocardia sp. NBC_00881]
MTAHMNYQHGGPGAAPGGHPPPYPHLPGHGYPPPQSSAGGGTGIAAALLALLDGGWKIFGLVSMGTGGSRTFDTLAGLALVSVAVTGFVAFLLILGGVLLLCRLTVGRVLVIVGSALSLINMAVGLAMVGLFGLLPIAVCVLTLATLVLAAISPTGRWIAGRRQSTLPYGHQPPPPYGQPSSPPYGYQPYGYPTAPPPGPPAPPYGQPPYPNR